MPLPKRLVLYRLPVPQAFIEDLSKDFGETFEFRASKSKQEALDLASQAEILVMVVPNVDVISAARNCKWIHALTAGVENFLEIDALRENENLMLTNSSGVHGIPISEHTFAMILAFTRQIKNSILSQAKGEWSQPKEGPIGSKTVEIHGKTMGIIGLGHIGLEIAKKAKSFGMKVIGTRKSKDLDLRVPSYEAYVDKIYSEDEIDHVLSQSDVVVDALPLTKETAGLFDTSKFSKFKTNSIFVNIGRGQTVVESDLIEALDNGKLGFAALDVFEKEPLPKDSPLWNMENVIISPHLAGWSPMYFERAHSIFKENLARYVRKEKLINLVDKKMGY